MHIVGEDSQTWLEFYKDRVEDIRQSYLQDRKDHIDNEAMHDAYRTERIAVAKVWAPLRHYKSHFPKKPRRLKRATSSPTWVMNLIQILNDSYVVYYYCAMHVREFIIIMLCMYVSLLLLCYACTCVCML